MSFASLGLSPAIVHAVREQGYRAPTPIQAAAIPAILRGADVLGLAQTGSGKTAAFALPLLQRLLQIGPDAARQPRVLLLVPTRELAVQVAEVIGGFARQLPERLKISSVFGGVSINPQMMALRGGADIIIATPGRLLDLIEHNAVRLSAVSLLVLDEADRLLDLGFAEELQRILALLPSKRQNLFFSATFAPALAALADGLLQDPERIVIETAPELRGQIAQRAIEVDASRRTPLLKHLLQTEGWERALVFVATKYATEHVSDKLWAAGIKAAALHGELSQGGRTRVLMALKTAEIQVLVATDVAARGLDIPELSAVINYDLPRSATDHTHRIGRTGRAGESGAALSFICADSVTNSEAHFRLIEKRQGQRINREQIAGFEPTGLASPEAAVGGVKGKRMSKKDKLRAAGQG